MESYLVPENVGEFIKELYAGKYGPFATEHLTSGKCSITEKNGKFILTNIYNEERTIEPHCKLYADRYNMYITYDAV